MTSISKNVYIDRLDDIIIIMMITDTTILIMEQLR